MKSKTSSLSKEINSLVVLWSDWMKINAISANDKLNYSVRRKASVKQEALIEKRYDIIERINKVFEK